MVDRVSIDRTRASTPTTLPEPLSRTRTIDELVEEVGHLRSRGRLLGDDVAEVGRQTEEIHRRFIEEQLNIRARKVAGRSAADLLEELAGHGFAWRDIARLVGVSVPAVRRWRQGEPPTGTHLLALARLVAFIETLSMDHLISDVAGWMEMPLAPEAPVTGIDLAAGGRYADLVELAAAHSTPEAVLDRWRPGWREHFRSDFEVFEAADGERGIRLRTRDDG